MMSSPTEDPPPERTHARALPHFLTTEGLDRTILHEILDIADSFIGVNDRELRKVPLLRGKTIANLFFEPSVRTRTTFELAAKRLSADVLNIDVGVSGAVKKESHVDAIRNLEAMRCDLFIVRHSEAGAASFIARQLSDQSHVINAGDGRHAHPTQALLDMLTIRRIKGDFSKLRIAIVGDLLHSRVFRSEIDALNTLGAGEVRVIAPRTLLPAAIEQFNVRVFTDLDAGIRDADVIIMLRLQQERMRSAFLPSQREYFAQYGLTAQRLARAHPDAIIMHPGPINRGVEIASDIADGSQSVILDQVHYGIALRMAILARVLNPISESHV